MLHCFCFDLFRVRLIGSFESSFSGLSITLNCLCFNLLGVRLIGSFESSFGRLDLTLDCFGFNSCGVWLVLSTLSGQLNTHRCSIRCLQILQRLLLRVGPHVSLLQLQWLRRRVDTRCCQNKKRNTKSDSLLTGPSNRPWLGARSQLRQHLREG